MKNILAIVASFFLANSTTYGQKSENYIFLGRDKTPIHTLENHNINPQLNSFHKRTRPHEIDVLHYDLEIFVDPTEGKIFGRSKIKFTALKKDLKNIVIDASDMIIKDVKNFQGSSIEFTYDNSLVEINFSAPLLVHDENFIEIFYEAHRSQSFFITGPDPTSPKRMQGAYTYSQPEGAQEWFPCFDLPSDKASLNMSISLPEGFNVLSNGELVGHDAQENTFHFSMPNPIATYLVSIAVGDYDIIEIGKHNDIPLIVYAPKNIREATLFETERTKQMMESFEKFTGVSYPFSIYSQSVAQAFGGSMEHQASTTMGGWRIRGDKSGEGVVAHELAHQWFGNYLTCNVWGEMWLNEGFATYLPKVFFDYVNENNSSLDYEDYWRQGYFRESKNYVRPISDADLNMDHLFDSHSYNKGALIIHLMRHLVNAFPKAPEQNEENFTLALKNYFSENAYKSVENHDLQKALEKITKTSWNVFFNQWVRSAGHPILQSSWRYVSDKSLIEIDIEQTQTKKEKPWRKFSFPLEVEIISATGHTTTKTVDIYLSKHTIEIPVDFLPSAIHLNPKWIVPAEISIAQSTLAREMVLAHSPHEKARINTMRSLLKNSEYISESLLNLLINDPSDYLKADAITRLTNSQANKDAVIALAQSMRDNFENLDTVAQNALLFAEAWLFSLSSAQTSEEEIEQMKAEYFSSQSTAKKESLFQKIASVSQEVGQTFALEALQSEFLVTRDRASLIDILSKPSEISHDFIVSSVSNASYYWQKRILHNLTQQKFVHEDLVEPLIELALQGRYLGSQARSLNLLSHYHPFKNKVCPIASLINLQSPSSYLKQASEKVLNNLSCPKISRENSLSN